MRRGFLIGLLIGGLSVTVLNADDDIHGPMTALRRIIVLMERLVDLSQQVADNTKAANGCGDN